MLCRLRRVKSARAWGTYQAAGARHRLLCCRAAGWSEWGSRAEDSPPRHDGTSFWDCARVFRTTKEPTEHNLLQAPPHTPLSLSDTSSSRIRQALSVFHTRRAWHTACAATSSRRPSPPRTRTPGLTAAAAGASHPAASHLVRPNRAKTTDAAWHALQLEACSSSRFAAPHRAGCRSPGAAGGT